MPTLLETVDTQEIITLLDVTRERHGITSDEKLAHYLGVSDQPDRQVSAHPRGTHAPDPPVSRLLKDTTNTLILVLDFYVFVVYSISTQT